MAEDRDTPIMGSGSEPAELIGTRSADRIKGQRPCAPRRTDPMRASGDEFIATAGEQPLEDPRHDAVVWFTFPSYRPGLREHAGARDRAEQRELGFGGTGSGPTAGQGETNY